MSTMDINYSLGVLIVLLMVFWFMCKCIGSSNNQSFYSLDRREKMNNMTQGGEFYYGNSPLYLGTPTGVHYITENYKNTTEVPNSKTAMRHLFDEDAYKCQALDTYGDFDQEPAMMFLNKTSVSKQFENRKPKSLTSTRENMCNDRSTRIPMSSY
jgi:hypothetical protein